MSPTPRARLSLSLLPSLLTALLPVLLLGVTAGRAEAQAPYSQNFDGLTAGASVAGWSNGSPAGAGVAAGSYVVTTNSPVSAPNAFGDPIDGHISLYTALASDSLQFDTITHGTTSANYSAIAPILCSDSSGTNFYLANYTPESGGLTWYRHSSGGGFTQIGNQVGTSFTAEGTALSIKFIHSGSILSLYVWPQGTTAPSSPTYTVTDPSAPLPSGYAGLRTSAVGSPSPPSVDNLVIGSPPAAYAYPDSAAWVVSPYNHNQTGSGASATDISVNPGYYRRIYVTGATTAALLFNTATGSADVIAYRWDGGPWTRAAVSSSIALSPPASTTVSHLLEWAFVACPVTSDLWASSPPVNALQFTGLQLSAGAAVSSPPVRPRRVICYGDSILNGIRTLSATAGYPVGDSDATLSAYFHLQDALNAEVGMVGFAGQGVVSPSNSAPENVPVLPSTYNLIYSGVSRSFAIQPELCVICEGQNDGGQSATTFLSGLNTVVAGVGAKKTLIMGDENGYFTTQEQSVTGATYAAPAALALSTSGATVDSYDGIHPSAAAHRAKMQPVISAASYPLLYGAGGVTDASVLADVQAALTAQGYVSTLPGLITAKTNLIGTPAGDSPLAQAAQTQTTANGTALLTANAILAKFLFDTSSFVKANTQVLPSPAPAGYGGGAALDPWGTLLPAFYPVGSAGWWLGHGQVRVVTPVSPGDAQNRINQTNAQGPAHP